MALYSMNLYFKLSIQIGFLICSVIYAAGDWSYYNNHYYYNSSETLNSGSARSRCVALGADLLSIADATEQSFLDRYKGMGYTMGLRFTSGDNNIYNWYWLDGTTYNAYKFHNWENDYPSIAYQYQCVRLYSTGEWRNLDCDGSAYKYLCKKQDPCVPENTECINGECSVLHNDTKYYCDCYAGYTGQKCETEINKCASNPCVNGKCIDLVNGFSCNCKDTGFEGELCEKDINECSIGESKCYFNSTCVNTPGSSYCDCVNGTTGEQCEADINECENDQCVNGHCIDELGGYICNCDSGWIGTFCDADIDECSPLLLQYTCLYGFCINTIGSYSCECSVGYTGIRCDQVIQTTDTKTYLGAFVASITLAGILLVVNTVWLIYWRLRNDKQKHCKQCMSTIKEKPHEYANIQGITQPADLYQSMDYISNNQAQPYEELNIPRT